MHQDAHSSEAPLRIRLLGEFGIDRLDVRRLGSRKARTLVKVLALARGRPVAVDRLVWCLWADEPPARPGEQVAVLVSRLRAVLGPDRLVRTDAGYRMTVDWLDVDAMADLTTEAARRLEAGRFDAARAASRAALALFRGPLLSDEPDVPWAVADRARVERVLAQARRVGAEAALAGRDAAAALELADAALSDDPFDEAALCVQMAAHAAAGRPAAALLSYEAMRERLAEELGVDPAPATREAHAAVLRTDVRSPRLPEPSPAREVTLVGRERELAALDDAVRRADAGTVEIVSIEGEAGIGKTRLLEVWAGRLEASGARVLRARCDELGRNLPLQAIGHALVAVLRRLPQREADDAIAADERTLGPLLGSGAGDAEPLTAKTALFAALVGVLGRLASDTPTVVVLDDAHVADPSTIEWLGYVRHRTDPIRLLVVASRRPEEGLAPPSTTTIRLGPLDLDAASAIVGADRAPELMERSGGHPLFLLELAEAAPDEVLPPSIRDAVAARCDRAGPAAATLRTAAVVGPDVDLDLLSALLRAPTVELLEHLEEGVRRAFLVEREGSFAFRHELVREALVAGTGVARRTVVHREAGRVLAQRGDDDPLRVAWHARLGGDRDLAARALVRAAEIAVERHDHDEADRWLQEAVALHDSIEARLACARVGILRGHYEDALDDAGAALALGGGSAALESAAWAAYYVRDFERARRLADDGVRLAEDPQIAASCLAVAGRVRFAHGDLDGAQQRLEEAVSRGKGPALVTASAFLGSMRAVQGRYDEALELLHLPTLPTAITGHAFVGVYAHLGTAHALAGSGRLAEAWNAVEAAAAEVERVHGARYVPRVDNYRSSILRGAGQLAAADELSERALEAALAGGMTEPAAYALLDLAQSRIADNDPDGTESLLARLAAFEDVEQVGRWRYELKAGLLRAGVALVRGRDEEASAAAADVREQAQRHGVVRYDVAARVTGALARAAAGEPIDVSTTLADVRRLSVLAATHAPWVALELAERTGVDAFAREAQAQVASLCARAGDLSDSLARYAQTRLAAARMR